MSRGGTRSSTWPKGQKPPVKKPKGALAKRTRLKLAVSQKDWEGLKNFIEGEGATKLIEEMKKLKGQQYVYAMQSIAEYVKPKLRRIDGTLNANLTLKDKKVKFE
jgi:hypothetical protein